MRKPPAFQVYTKDFDTDENVMLMDCEQEGAYSRLLRVHWREGSVPEAVDELAALVRMPKARFTKHVWPLVGRCFVKRTKDGALSSPDGRLINPRMARDWMVLAEFRRERAETGKRGVEKRWREERARRQQNKSHSSAKKEPKAVDSPPFSVLQSSITETKNGRDAAADAPALSPIQLEDGNPGNGNGRTDGNAFPATRAADVYRRHYPKGDVPKPMFRALKPLAVKHGWAAVEPELEAYLAATDVQFHNWPKFASGFGSWASSPGTALARPGGRASPFPTRSERNQAAAEEYLRTRAAREGGPS